MGRNIFFKIGMWKFFRIPADSRGCSCLLLLVLWQILWRKRSEEESPIDK